MNKKIICTKVEQSIGEYGLYYNLTVNKNFALKEGDLLSWRNDNRISYGAVLEVSEHRIVIFKPNDIVIYDAPIEGQEITWHETFGPFKA